jgi:hypothetical protein
MTKRNGHNPRPEVTIRMATDRPVDEHAREVARVNDAGAELRHQREYAKRRVKALIDALALHTEKRVIAEVLDNAGMDLRSEIEVQLRLERQRNRGKK